MKKGVHIIIGFAMVVGVTTQAYAQDSQQNGPKGERPSFSSIDTDNSSDIDYDEFSAQTLPHGDPQTIFDEIDTDANGVLSAQEFNDYKPPRPPQRQ